MAVRGKLAANNAATDLARRPSHSTLSLHLQESDLLLYFDQAVLPRFQIQEGQVELDFDIVLQNGPLQKAILAVSQAHYTLTAKCEYEAHTSVRKTARQSALRSFRELLDSGIVSSSSAQQLFTVNVLLCILDGVIEPSDPSNASVCHLRGGFAILDHWNGAAAQMLLQGGLTSHLLSVFATMDLVHALVSGDKPYFEPILWLMFADVQTWWGCLSAADPFLSLLKSFSEMASLGNMIFSGLPAKDSLALVEKCLPIFERNLVSNSNEKLGMDGFLSEDEQRWNIFCSIYKYCGIIYVQRALRLRPVNDKLVQLATCEGLRLITDDLLPGMMSHCLIFPILVTGYHCTDKNSQDKLMNVLAQTASHLSFGSLPLMTDFLRESWKTDNTTSNWWECFAAISGQAFFF